MNAPEPPAKVVDRYFRAMQAGASAADELFSLFDDNAVYHEPFTGQRRTHSGRPAIEDHLRSAWQTAPPDMRLSVDRVDIDGPQVTTRWTCTSPVFPHPMRGQDVCTVRDGRIVHLDVTFLPPESP